MTRAAAERYVVYRRNNDAIRPPADAANLDAWTPSLTRIRPAEIVADARGFTKNWVFHLPSIIAGRTPYRAYLFRQGPDVVAECLVSGKSARFPFMAPGDLQIGLVHTHPGRRNEGLAHRMVAAVIALHRQCDSFWWLTTPSNTASCRVAEKSGFTQVGIARRSSRLGIPRFVLSDP